MMSIVADAKIISICKLTPYSQNFTVTFKVLRISEPRRVTTKRTGKAHLVANAVIADSTGKIDLTLWNWDVDEVERGKVYTLEGGRVDVYEESMRIVKERSGKYLIVEDLELEINTNLNMSRPFIWKKKKRKKPRSKTGPTFAGVQGTSSKGYCGHKDF